MLGNKRTEEWIGWFGELMALLIAHIQTKGANEIFLKRKGLKSETIPAGRCNDHLNYSIITLKKNSGVRHGIKT